MSWHDDSKLLDEIQKYTATCKCGHRQRLTNKYRRAICQFCGNMVYLNKEDQKKEEFKSKMRSILNETNKNGNSTIQK